MVITDKKNTKRVNLTLSMDDFVVIEALAHQEATPTTTKAAQLLKLGLELEEDRILGQIADERSARIESGEDIPLSHDYFWSQALNS